MKHSNGSSVTKAGLLAAALGLLGTSLPVWGHPGHELAAGFLGAAVHPLTGLDHLLAALTTGLLAMHLGGLHRTAMPGAYLLGLGAGAALHALMQRAGLRPAQAGGIPVAVAGTLLLAQALA